jgi:hypothetical protein
LPQRSPGPLAPSARRAPSTTSLAQDPRSSISAPEVRAAANSSSAMNRTPSAHPANSTTSSGTVDEPRHEPTMAATSCRSRGANASTGETRRACRDRASSSRNDGPSSRTVTAQRARSAARLSARYSTIMTVLGSPQYPFGHRHYRVVKRLLVVDPPLRNQAAKNCPERVQCRCVRGGASSQRRRKRFSQRTIRRRSRSLDRPATQTPATRGERNPKR